MFESCWRIILTIKSLKECVQNWPQFNMDQRIDIVCIRAVAICSLGLFFVLTAEVQYKFSTVYVLKMNWILFFKLLHIYYMAVLFIWPFMVPFNFILSWCCQMSILHCSKCERTFDFSSLCCVRCGRGLILKESKRQGVFIGHGLYHYWGMLLSSYHSGDCYCSTLHSMITELKSK